MSSAHVCDECKTVAPLDEAHGWWTFEALSTTAGVLIRMGEKTEYQFCSWACASAYTKRMSDLFAHSAA